MSGIVLTQSNTTIEIDTGSGLVDFPCTTAIDPGTPNTNFVDVTCFSTPTTEPEYATGRKTRSVGSATYNVDHAQDVHQWLLANQSSGATVDIKVTVTYKSGFVAERTQTYLVGAVTEAVNFDQIFTNSVELQPTGAVTRNYTPPV